MTTETLLMGNSLGHPSLDVQVYVRRLRQTSSYVSRKSFNINRQVSVVKQGVSARSFRYFEQILYVIHFMVNDLVFIANKVSDVFIANKVSDVSRLP